MRIALLGLPEAGKTTIFSLLTGREIPEFRKAGETLEGRARVSDPRVDRLSLMENPAKTTYAQTEVVLCPDVETGAGDPPWLKEARLCDLLCLVVRAFTTDEVYHPEGSVDPKRDRHLLEAELILADLDLVEKRLERIAADRKKKKPLPRQVLEESTEFNSKGYHPVYTIHPDDCLNCGLCELICPEFAIRVKLFEKEKVKGEECRA